MKLRKNRSLLAGAAVIAAAMSISCLSGEEKNEEELTMTPRKFRIEVSKSDLEDLRYRLKHTRLPVLEKSPGWADGTDPAYVQDLVDYWATSYDWRKAEAEINAYPNYKVKIDGTEIHFIHLPSKNPKAKALVLTHGWPDTFYRYLRVLPLLTDKYHLIVPSLPGYGFSGHDAKNSEETANLWVKLVTEVLGYPDFYASGGDMGAGVTLSLARKHQDVVRGVHLTDVGWSGTDIDPALLGEAEKAFTQQVNYWFMSEGAYIMMHSTKPLTAAYGLSDSPAALAAWAASFSNNGRTENYVDTAFGGRDAFLTNLSIYWFTRTSASALSLYKRAAEATWGAHAGNEAAAPSASKTAPVALSLYPRDFVTPREWAERQGLNVRYYKVLPEGGHFAALEVPELFAADLRESLDALEEARGD